MLNDFCRKELKDAVRPVGKTGYHSSAPNPKLDDVIGKIQRIYPEMFHDDENKLRLFERVFFDEPTTPTLCRRVIWAKPK
jgi:hypothetical protein